MKWQCECGSVADQRLGFCPTCWRGGLYVPIVERRRYPAGNGVVQVAAMDLARQAAGNFKPGGVWDRVFPEGLGVPSMLVIFGPPGSGKTTLGLELADSWKGKAAVLPFEQGLGPALAGLVRRLEITKPTFLLGETWEEIREAVSAFDLIVVDSLQRSGIDAEDWKNAFLPIGKTVVLLSEINIAGEVRGGLGSTHLSDIAVELGDYGTFAVRKNRFGVLMEGSWNALPVLL